MSTPSPRSSSALSIGTPEHYRWLRGIVATVLVLNLLDAVFTLVWIQAGHAREANPVLRDLIHAARDIWTSCVPPAMWVLQYSSPLVSIHSSIRG